MAAKNLNALNRGRARFLFKINDERKVLAAV
jgi:hypothetical protein